MKIFSIPSLALLALLVPSIHPNHLASAFCLLQTTLTLTPAATTTTITSSSPTKLSASALDDELDALETARANFEFLMQTEGLVKENLIVPLPHSKEEYTPRPLTESDRKKRELEIKLLQSLVDSDEGIEQVMSLWMVDRGQDAAFALQRMEGLCSPGLVEEEAVLRQLMDEYGIHWAEPVSRLASLLYFKGRSTESRQWCEIAMAVKPWHFECVHTQVLNALRRQDFPDAVRWQRKALPALNASRNNKRRKAWVRQAVEDARESLQKAETAALEQKRESRSLWKNEVWQ